MEYWAKPPVGRGQMVLFATRLDEVLAAGHAARMLDEILARIDWSPWEVGYDLTKGQPPIHPRVLASVILYGLLTRIRSSRMLEEALSVRLDFRWLAEGRSIDHTTLSTFRKRYPEALKNLFVQIGLLASELGHVTLAQLAGWPRRCFERLGCRATRGYGGHARLSIPLVPASPRHPKRCLGHPARFPSVVRNMSIKNVFIYVAS